MDKNKKKIIKDTRGNNSFIVQLDDGAEYERHRHHIRDDKAHNDYNDVQIIPQIPEDISLEDNVGQEEEILNQETYDPDINDQAPCLTQAASPGPPQRTQQQTQQVEQQFEHPFTRSRGRLPALSQSW